MIDERYIRQEAVTEWGPLRYSGSGLLLYEYVRGSHAYGLATEESDQDRGGVFLSSNDALLGMTAKNGMYGYSDMEHSESNDEVWYEFSRFGELLCECNPNILESLFLDDKFVLYEHPIISELKKRRQEFITKECFVKFGGYAKSQIMKASGLNKKIVTPVLEKKSPLDFCYTFYNQGSTKISNWLEYRGLHQEFCGLVAIPNMHNTYGVYYDWAAHIDNIPGMRDVMKRMYRYRAPLGGTYDFTNEELDMLFNFETYCWGRVTNESLSTYDLERLLKVSPAYYRGIVKDDSQDLRLSSVPEKDARPICFIVYNQEGYSKHARDYTAYKKWEQERNPVRYSLNKGHEFDAKNMMHCFRLLTMCCEIAESGRVIIDRTGYDREFLLSVRNHQYTYEELMKNLQKMEEYRKELQENSTIPETIDKKKFNRWLIEQRKTYGSLY